MQAGDRCLDALQRAFDGAASGRRQPVEGSAESGVCELLDHVLISRDTHDHEVDRALGPDAELRVPIKDSAALRRALWCQRITVLAGGGQPSPKTLDHLLDIIAAA